MNCDFFIDQTSAIAASADTSCALAITGAVVADFEVIQK